MQTDGCPEPPPESAPPSCPPGSSPSPASNPHSYSPCPVLFPWKMKGLVAASLMQTNWTFTLSASALEERVIPQAN